jgi:hypothetical protein
VFMNIGTTAAAAYNAVGEEAEEAEELEELEVGDGPRPSGGRRGGARHGASGPRCGTRGERPAGGGEADPWAGTMIYKGFVWT